MKKLLAFLLTLVLAVAVFGCGGKRDDEVLPTGLKLNLASEVEVGSFITGKLTWTPNDTTNKNVKWESSNPEVATVKDGKVTGIAAGKVTITVTSEAASNVKASAEVTVVATEAKELEGISFVKESEAVAPGATTIVKIKFEPAEAADKSVTWSSSDESIATVVAGSKAEEALVTGVADGNCVIKVESKSNPSIKAELPLTVDESAAKVYVTAVDLLTEGRTDLFVAESVRFSVTFNNSNLDNRPSDTSCTWETSDPEVATVSEYGTITGISEGTVTIKCIPNGVEPGKEGTIFAEVTLKINAIVPPTSFTAEPVNDQLIPGAGTTIKIIVEPENGDKRATFESSNPEVAAVDESGKITTTAESNGDATITVTSTADPTKSVSFVIHVAKEEETTKPESVTIKGEQTTYVGEAYSLHLQAVVLPATASQEVKWTSNNEAVATVDEFGVVTGVSIGTARIRAISKVDEDVKSPFFTITVTELQVHEAADLQGYEIIIMNAESALGDIDPFLDSYTQPDKSYKQEAWRQVETDFNCKISVKPYPADAPWGEPRINWIITNANQGTSQCDLGTISTNWIYRFAQENGNAAVDVSDYYYKYGESQMSVILKESGSFHQKIYVASTGISPVSINVDFGLYYNLAMLEKLGVENPAKMFNEGKWTYSNFSAWVQDVQAKLGSTEEEPKYALCGHPYYWWFGLTNAAGIKVADTTAIKVNLTSSYSQQGAAMYWDLFQKGCIDEVGSWCESSSDGNAWFKGTALMTTGYLWFVKNPSRWYCDDDKKMWGDDTRFGYVPFPYPDDLPKDQTRISTSGLSAYLYVRGREYPAGVTIEGIYQAVNQMYLDTIKRQKADPLFSVSSTLDAMITKRIDDPNSIEAIKFFDSNKLFFDPAHGIYTSTSATPVKTPCVNVMMKGAEYEEEFMAVFSAFDTAFRAIYG